MIRALSLRQSVVAGEDREASCRLLDLSLSCKPNYKIRTSPEQGKMAFRFSGPDMKMASYDCIGYDDSCF